MNDRDAAEYWRSEYQRLRQALPILPEPEDLYSNIVRASRRFKSKSAAVETLATRIRSLSTSSESWIQRDAAHKLHDLMADKLKIDFILLRTQWGTLWTVPSLLYATRSLTPQQWTHMLSQPQYADDGSPLVLDSETMNQAINDQLEKLNDLKNTLRDLREEIDAQERVMEDPFRSQVLSELRTLTNLLTPGLPATPQPTTFEVDVDRNEQVDAKADVGDAMKAPTEDTDTQKSIPMERDAQEDIAQDVADLPEVDAEQNPEDEQVLDAHGDASVPDHNAREAEIQQDNAEFMEPIELMEDEDDAVSEDLQIQVEDLIEVDEAHDDELDDAPGQQQNPQPEQLPNRQAEEEDPEERERRKVIELQARLRQARQAARDLWLMIGELMGEERCAPRRFDDGIIQNWDERDMPCVFCGARGVHYSDACTVYINVSSRIQILDDTRRCHMCLDDWCNGSRRCRKFDVPCYHCKRTGHSAVICRLPERSRDIDNQLFVLQRDYEQARDRVSQLTRRLRRRGIDI